MKFRVVWGGVDGRGIPLMELKLYKSRVQNGAISCNLLNRISEYSDRSLG